MSYRSLWAAAKKGMDTVGIESKKLFKEDLGPALDAYEAACAAVDKIKGTEPEKHDAARKTMLAAANKAELLIASYLKSLKFFETGLTNAPKQKAAVDKALTVLSMEIFAPIRKETKGVG